jgi:denticleless
VFLFDVSNASRVGRDLVGEAVEMRGQKGEVGAVDWAEGCLASCADDGTVRVWRPDVEVHSECVELPEERQWDWSWARRHHDLQRR